MIKLRQNACGHVNYSFNICGQRTTFAREHAPNHHYSTQCWIRRHVPYHDIKSRWPEIKNALFPGRNFIDRLYIAVLVFHINLNNLMYFVIDEDVVKKGRAPFRVIEFQKMFFPMLVAYFSVLQDP